MAQMLFIKSSRDSEFVSFSKNLFSCLKISDCQKRFSGNSPGGVYFLAQVLGLSCKLQIADDIEFAAYDYSLLFIPTAASARDFSQTLDDLVDVVGVFLVSQGYKAAKRSRYEEFQSPIVEYQTS